MTIPMTIERFSGWGSPVEDQAEVEIFADDAELAAAAYGAIETGQRLQASVAAGDLLTTLGLESPRSGSERFQYPIDLGLVRARGQGGNDNWDNWKPFVAHAVAGRALGPGWFCVVMNTPWLGSWRLGPRAHPNDGKLDITSGALPLGEIPEARRRALGGTHIPHPLLEHRRKSEFEIDFRRKAVVHLDGRRLGRCQAMAVKTIPDALLLIA